MSIREELRTRLDEFTNNHVYYLKTTLIPDLAADGMDATADEFQLDVTIIEALQAKIRRMEQAMEGIRFVAFKHAESYWQDAEGTDDEKLSTIVQLSRESNWGDNGTDRTAELVKKHK